MTFNLGATEFVPSWYKKKGDSKPTEPRKERAEPSSPPPTQPEAKVAPATSIRSNNEPSKLSPDAIAFQPRAAAKPPKPKPGLPTVKVNAVEAVGKKSVDEVLQLAEKSAFKVGSVFIPAGYVPKNAELSQKKPVEKIEVKGPMTLRDSWSLYFIDRSLVTETNFDPILVFRMDCVEDFCKVFNNIPEASEMPASSTYYFFRADIEPKWEDARNREGGVWQLRFRSTDPVLDDVWARVTAQAIGEKWIFDEHRDSVNGVVLKQRNHFHILQIWVAEKKQHFPNDLLNSLEKVLPAFDIDYYDHQTMRECSVPKPKPKNKKKKGGF